MGNNSAKDEKVKPGDRIAWMSIKGPQSGVIETKFGNGWLTRLDNGKCVLVNEKSIKR